jgi:hypothetical protein
MAEISQNVYLHRPIINQFRLQNEREIVEQHEKHQILKNNLSLTDFGSSSNKCINNNNFLNNNNLIDNRNTSESSRRKEPPLHHHLYSSTSSTPSTPSTVAPIHASQMNDIKVSFFLQKGIFCSLSLE